MGNRIASQLQERKTTKTTDVHYPIMALPRTIQECQIQYERIMIQQQYQQQPWTKEESLFIIQQVQEQQQRRKRKHDYSKIDWETIVHNCNSIYITNRSIWECMVYYQTQCIPIQPEVWTIPQDLLLYQLIACYGIQYVLDGLNIQDPMIKYFLSTKSKKQIFHRMNQSLLNPNLYHSIWDNHDERRLVILMKIYSSNHHHHHQLQQPQKQQQQNKKQNHKSAIGTTTMNTSNSSSMDQLSDLYLTSTHFIHRSTKSVVDKWQRTMIPKYCTKPFTKQEDQLLLEGIRILGIDSSWIQISQLFLPNRHPQRILNRWCEIGHDHDIIQRSKNKMIMNLMKKRKSKYTITTSNTTTTPTAQINDGGESTTEHASLTVDELVVQVKRKRIQK